LEAAGFLVSDARHPDHAGDLFSLIAVYRAAIVRDVDAHCESVCVMKKKKDTRWAALLPSQHKPKKSSLTEPILLALL
jgi:hypothetical protein